MKIKESIRLKYFSIKLFLVSLSLAIFILQSCKENPNDLGITLIPPFDTSAVRYLDSQIDTMAITSNNYKQFINTSTSKNILIGIYQNYQSKALIKFKGISPEYDSVNVTSAILTLRYSYYYFKDQMGTTAFNIYKVNNNYNYSTITYDSVTSSGIGNISLGSFSGVVVSDSINVPIDNQTAKDWLEYAADTNYVNKNYGIALLPDMSSTTIKGFYSNNSDTADYVPYTTIIFIKNNVTDTITLITSEYVSLSDAPASIIPAERFILQNGIAYRNILNFDLTKLPSNVIINNVTLQFTLDKTNSFIPSTTAEGIGIDIGMVTDSVTKNVNFSNEPFFPLDSINYSAQLNSFFQQWNSGISPNLGISMKNGLEIQNLNYLVFYSPNASDISKRPRLKITYTPRN